MAKSMTKSAIFGHLSQKTALTKKQIDEVMDELHVLATKEAKNGFVLPDFGRLVLANRKARMGRNPQTENHQDPRQACVKFRLAKSMKDRCLARSNGWGTGLSVRQASRPPWNDPLSAVQLRGCMWAPVARPVLDRQVGEPGRRAALRGALLGRARGLGSDAARSRGGGHRRVPPTEAAVEVCRVASWSDRLPRQGAGRWHRHRSTPAPKGLDRIWVRSGFIPVPEAELPKRPSEDDRELGSSAGGAAPRSGARPDAAPPAAAPSRHARAMKGPSAQVRRPSPAVPRSARDNRADEFSSAGPRHGPALPRREYASRAAIGRRLAAGPFSSL